MGLSGLNAIIVAGNVRSSRDNLEIVWNHHPDPFVKQKSQVNEWAEEQQNEGNFSHR